MRNMLGGKNQINKKQKVRLGKRSRKMRRNLPQVIMNLKKVSLVVTFQVVLVVRLLEKRYRNFGGKPV